MNERVFPTKGRFRGTYAGDVTDCVGSRGERSHGTLTRESEVVERFGRFEVIFLVLGISVGNFRIFYFYNKINISDNKCVV